ncbi:hypothetical protein D3C80_1612210 [compost metagenome]
MGVGLQPDRRVQQEHAQVAAAAVTLIQYQAVGVEGIGWDGEMRMHINRPLDKTQAVPQRGDP